MVLQSYSWGRDLAADDERITEDSENKGWRLEIEGEEIWNIKDGK